MRQSLRKELGRIIWAATGQYRLKVGRLKTTYEKKSMFGIGGCEEVWSSIFWAQRRVKRGRQMKGCVAEQKVSDWQMNAWTLQTCDIVRDRLGVADNQYQELCRLRKQALIGFAVRWEANEVV